MKKLLFLLLFFYSCYLHAQNFSFPLLQSSATSLDELIPAAWFLKDSAAGDLNGDKLDDLALVLEYKDTIAEKRPDGSVNKGSPRVLAVYLKNAISGNYHHFLQNNTFIIRYGEGGMDPEAYDQLEIARGVLKIYFSFLRGNAIYTFRLQHSDLFLIGGSTAGVSGGKFYGFSANFSTGKAEIKEGPIDSDKTKVTWVKVPKKPLKKLRHLKMAFQWEVIKNQYL